MHEITLMITPVPKGRPRARRNGIMYTPKKTADYERDIAKLLGHLPAIMGPIGMSATFVLKRPVKTPKSVTGRFIKAGSRGDLDNYIKALLDGCQRAGVVPNDAAVVELGVTRKVYAAQGEEPHIELKLWPIKEGMVTSSEEEDSNALHA